MNWISAFLSVIAIIGIIIVGGFVIFFLGDIVLSVLDPNYVRFGRGKKGKENKDEFSNGLNEDIRIKEIEGKETKEIEYKPLFQTEEKKEPVIEQGIDNNFFDDLKEQNKEFELEEEKSQDLNALRAEEEQFRANMLKAIEERRARKDEYKPKDIDFDKFFFDDEDIDVFEEEDDDDAMGIVNTEEVDTLLENKDETIEDEVVEDESEEVNEVEETEGQNDDKVNNDELETLRKKFKEELSKLEVENLEIKKEKERLEKETISAKEEIAKLFEEKLSISKDLEEECINKGKSKGSLTIEEYEVQLAKLRERLAENEKELRKIKKEFIPLRRVNKTLENDERKLRRREAIVAKQKVELYGVNNIVDIDQEKAKKLTEDLDLLEGLKLSVKHCEEVMLANKERYPILEKTYTILSDGNKTIKEDIADLEDKIAKIKADEE